MNPNTKSSDILLSLSNRELKVWKVHDNTVCVNYEHCEVSDGMFLIGTFGRGHDFESACDDYLSKIRGKTLVFDANWGDKRKEVTVLG